VTEFLSYFARGLSRAWQHGLYFSQNQQEISAAYVYDRYKWHPVVNFQRPASYYCDAERYVISRMRRSSWKRRGIVRCVLNMTQSHNSAGLSFPSHLPPYPFRFGATISSSVRKGLWVTRRLLIKWS